MYISFIIPAKNEEKRIIDCLESICSLENNNNQIEIIVIDNGSIDNTVLIAQKCGALVYVKPNITIGEMRNYGAAKAKGDLLVFVDADVVLSKRYIVSALEQVSDTSIGIITGRIGTPSKSTWVQRAWDLNRQKSKPIMFIDWASSMNMIIRKEVFFEVGGFTPGLITCEDVDISRKVISAGFKILYNANVAITHMGDAKNIKEFFLKERWRGKSQAVLKPINSTLLNIIVSYQFSIYTALILIFIVSSFTLSSFATIVSLVLLLVLPLVRSCLIVINTKKYLYVLPLVAVWTVYYAARSISLIEGTINKLQAMANKDGRAVRND